MRRCLLLINLLALLSVLPCHAQETAGDSVVGSEYTFFMQARGQEITGICMVSQSPDGQTTGTIVNEFGVKAFDFMIDNGKVKIINVIKPLDRWYIRKALKKEYPDFETFRAKFQVPQKVIDEVLAEAAKKDSLKARDDAELEKTMENMRLILKGLVARDLWDFSEYFQIIYADDPVVLKALEVLQQ